MKRKKPNRPKKVIAATKLAAFRLSHECIALLQSLAEEAGRGTGRDASKVSVLETAVRYYARRGRQPHAGQ